MNNTERPGPRDYNRAARNTSAKENKVTSVETLNAEWALAWMKGCAEQAHEAIRPAGESFATPGQLSGQLDAEEFKLYDLIWKRTVASQMADAKGTSMKVTVAGTAAADKGSYDVEFSATGRTITFPGFLKAYGADDAKGDKKGETRLPHLEEGRGLTAKEVSAEGHSTNPPARYTEASLVKKWFASS